MRGLLTKSICVWWLLFCISPPAQALAPDIRPLLFEPAGSTQFWVNSNSSIASDTNNGCRNRSRPCLTLAHLNTVKLPYRSTVNIAGSFAVNDALAFTTSNASNNLTIVAYGTGATINSGTSTPCISAVSLAGVSIIGTARQPITCVGAGVATNTTAGVTISNAQAGNTKIAGPMIYGVTISGYGGNGIEVKGTSGTSGFYGITITKSVVHDVTGNGGITTGCINIFSSSYGTNNVHRAVVVSWNTIYNCTGQSGQTSWTGSGVVVSETQGATLQYNVVHDFGANNTHCGGPVGAWSFDADQITIQYNEVYNGGSNYGAGGCDGDAFDHDGGTTNSVIQYNYAHNNVGNCILYTAYADATITTQANNTARFNVCQSNNTGNNGIDEIQLTALSGATMTNPMVYNNVIYAGFGRAIGSAPAASPGTISGGFVANNIFIGSNSANIVQMPVTGPAFTGNDYFCYPTLSASCTPTFSYSGTAYASFSAWQTATGQEKIASVNVGLTSNPQLNAPGTGFTNGGYVTGYLQGYNLQAVSPMIGGGVDVAAQYGVNIGSQDYFGNAPGTKLVGAAAGTGTLAPFCTASTNLLARMTSPTMQDQVIADYIVCALNSSGDLANLDFVHYFAFASQTNALLNLLSSSYNDTTGNSPTFTAGQGFTGNGSNAYLAPTSYIPSLGGTKLVLNSGSMGVYDITSRTSGSGNNSMGANSAGGSAFLGVWALTGSAPFFAFNDATGGAATAITNSQGCTAIQRTAASGAGSSAIFRNKANVGSFANASVQIAASIVTSLAFNNATSQPTITPTQGTTDTLSADFAGNGSVSVTNVCAVLNIANMAKSINAFVP